MEDVKYTMVIRRSIKLKNAAEAVFFSGTWLRFG